MSERVRVELERMLDRYDEQRRGDLARAREAGDEDAEFIAQFVELRRSVVRPVFDAASAILAEHGHAVRISQVEFSADPSGQTTEAGISIQITPASMGSHAGERRSLSISTRHYNKTVWIHDDGAAFYAGGKAALRGAYALERIDGALVEEELIRFVDGVVAS
jgi:hypothetical protein